MSRKSERTSRTVFTAGGEAIEEFKWTKLLEQKTFLKYENSMDAKVFNNGYIQRNGLTQPILFENTDGLDMEIPFLTVDKVRELVGKETIVDVLEVSTQTTRQMNLEEWADYFNLPAKKRDRILNVITLEIGESPLGKMIKRPRMVRELDWIDIAWPRDIRVTEYPRVQLYCLMGAQDSYTDFHIDFGGTSVFYHIISGSKVFYFIPPSNKNLEIYSKWSTSPEQSNTFLGDLVSECFECHLTSGNTMIIPSGWIHAVRTPVDTIVIGGNFLHGFSIGMQLRIAQLEKDTNVPMRYRFPYFTNMQWYAAKKYLNVLKGSALRNIDPAYISEIELDCLQDLVDYLGGLALLSTNFSKMSKEERKTVRSEVPANLKNVSLLVENLKLAISQRKNHVAVDFGDDGWESDLTEMEFVDSDEELDDFLPSDVPMLTSEEDEGENTEDSGGFFDSDSDDEDSAKKKMQKLKKAKALEMKRKAKAKANAKVAKKKSKKELRLAKAAQAAMKRAKSVPQIKLTLTPIPSVTNPAQINPPKVIAVPNPHLIQPKPVVMPSISAKAVKAVKKPNLFSRMKKAMKRK